jgi:hypothetical protein
VADRVVIKLGKSGSAGEAPASVSRHADLAIVHGKLTGGPRVVRVTQGDRVDLRWSSDETVQLHLHGYDIETTITPDTPVTMQFVAHATGRFAVELHGGTQQGSGHGHHALTHIEVHPR